MFNYLYYDDSSGDSIVINARNDANAESQLQDQYGSYVSSRLQLRDKIPIVSKPKSSTSKNWVAYFANLFLEAEQESGLNQYDFEETAEILEMDIEDIKDMRDSRLGSDNNASGRVFSKIYDFRKRRYNESKSKNMKSTTKPRRKTSSSKPKSPRKYVTKQGPLTKEWSKSKNKALWTRSNKTLYSLLKTNGYNRDRKLIYYILSTRRGRK